MEDKWEWEVMMMEDKCKLRGICFIYRLLQFIYRQRRVKTWDEMQREYLALRGESYGCTKTGA
ncbi:MAG: hypothetical protein KAH38_08460 [Candidatus Hydrogenedentes bacterium]|nr:hypothetical protein [Candidatus Hydrogenedentota bacterium]